MKEIYGFQSQFCQISYEIELHSTKNDFINKKIFFDLKLIFEF